MNNKKWLIVAGLLVLFAGATFFAFSFGKNPPSDEVVSLFKAESKQQLVASDTSEKQSIAPKQHSSQTPAQLFNLTNWKLTLPITSSDDSTKPLEIRQPELETYQLSPWFGLTPDKKGIVFRAPVNAQTTVNSTYPRSELREMTADGKDEIFWSSTEGVHTLFIDQAITAIPKNKQDIVAGQIHGDDSDLIVVRLEGQKLFLARNRENLATLDDDYALGRRFTVKFEVKGGEIDVYYNNSTKPVYILEKKVNEAYFKVGAYTQSNCEREELPELCSLDNYGEVTVYQIEIKHE